MIITVDISGWTQEQKNLTKAMCVSLLHKAGIDYEGISVSLPNIVINNPSVDPSEEINRSSIEAAYSVWKAKDEEETSKVIAESQARKAELKLNEIAILKLEEVDAIIDSLDTMVKLREFLKKLVRYIIARNK